MPAAIIPLKRANVSEAVADAVRAMIIDGRLPESGRVNEVRLSESLGVSRTPLREALNRLAAEGALAATPGHGFSVRPLTLAEFEQLYAIRPLLDPAALALAGIPSPARLAELERINRKLAAARDPESAVARDDEWHLALLAGCPNRILVELIEGVIARTRRYEIALMRETKNILRATGEHDRILDALRKGDLDSACSALRDNMQSANAPMAAWLAARKPRR